MKNLIYVLSVVCFSCLVWADDPSIIVSGDGEVKVAPDIASISFTVSTKAKEAKLARKRNAEETNRVFGLLDSTFKIDKKDIQTSSFDLSPDYTYDPKTSKQNLQGFRASHNFNVKIKNIEKVGEIIDKLVVAGSEDKMLNLNGISFDTDKHKEYELQALAAAMTNAEARARVLAKSGSRSLGQVIRIVDRVVNTDGPVPMHNFSQMAMMSKTADSTNVSPGQLTVKSKVTVEYLLK